VRYGCLKIIRYNGDNIRVGKQGSIWNNGGTTFSLQLRFV
jgi:hypothetical protein